MGKELQKKSEELQNYMLSTDECKEMAWYKAADRGHLELLKKLRGWAKELQLNQRS